MKKQLLRLLHVVLLFISVNSFAQDFWTPAEKAGFGTSSNHVVKCLLPFKGYIYSGTGEDAGYVYRSATGSIGWWNNVFLAANVTSIDAMAATTEGAGYMYISAYANGGDLPKVYRSDDGTTWTDVYDGFDRITHIIPFKGTGTTDSIYMIQHNTFGAMILRMPYDSNDPQNLLGGTDTVLDFGTTSIYSQVKSAVVHNGKLYAGTDYGTAVWQTSNGTDWQQNSFVGAGFGNTDNLAISAMISYGGYLYVGTRNYASGCEIWRSANDTAWTQVATYPGYETVENFGIAGTELFVGLYAGSNNPGKILRSTDGLSFSVSNDDGFGDMNNQGEYANFAYFKNNLFYASQNYGSIPTPSITPANEAERGSFFSTGGQIRRLCMTTVAPISIGPDNQTACGQIVLAVNNPFIYSSFYWNFGAGSSSYTFNQSGTYSVIVTDTNNCDATDTVNVTILPEPTVSIAEGAAITVCAGNSIDLHASAISNARIPETPIHKTTNMPVSYSLGNSYDTISVSSLSTECSCVSLLSVTIDSLYHPFDGDVSIGLYSPSGYFINLSNNVGGNVADYIGTEFNRTATMLTSHPDAIAPYTGQFAPLDSFGDLTGLINGNWILQVNDNYATDDGVLKGWSIAFSYADTVITFSWSSAPGLSGTTTPTVTITPPSDYSYQVTATNSIGCDNFVNISVTVPAISVTATSDSLCHGVTAVLTTTGGVNAIWSPAATLSSSTGSSVTASPLATTTYYVTDTLLSCAAVDSIIIYTNPILSPYAGLDQSICAGDTTIIDASGTSGGTAPYSYFWHDGTNMYTNQTEQVVPASSLTFTLDVTDAFGCLQSDVMNITVSPSTDIYGQATYSGGPVALSNVVLYKYQPTYIQFDTVQMVVTDASGNFHFPSIGHDNYLVEIFPAATYTTLVPTYYGNKFLWDSATVVSHDCAMNDTLNIAAVEETSFGTGPGYLHGRIVEGDGYERVPGDPVPGIDVKLGRNPGGQMVTQTNTDGNGEYSFSNVAFGTYTVYADVPGLGRDSSYTFTVDSANISYNYLNYIIDSTTVHYVPDAGVGIHPVAAADAKFSVYPNPSKGNVTVEYSVTANTHVSLGIYNVLGVKVAELVNTEQAAGIYKYSITESDFHPQSGVYFVTLIAEGKTSIHKIIITQ